MTTRETTADLIALIDAERARLRKLLRAADAATLGARPANGQWSVVENLRHLLFAEELHLGWRLLADRGLSAMGLPPVGMQRNPRFAEAGTDPTTDAAEVMKAWDAAHARIRRRLRSARGDDVARILEASLRHLRAHVRVIERLLRQQPGARR